MLQSGKQLLKRKSFIAMVVLLSGLVACGVNLFTINDDVAFGRQMDQEIKANPQEYPILNNESVRGYVQGIVDRILQSPDIKYRGTFPYTVTVINDDATINAFATPGGYIYVYTGLLRFLDNEASLAGVIGHEIAHAEERHGTEHLTQQLGFDVALQIALGNNPSRLAQIAGNAAALLAMLRNSRSDELEADTRSFGYLRSTPYFPGSIKYFFEKMENQPGATTGGKLEEWTSTHPTGSDRVTNINTLLRDNNIPAPTPASLMADNYRTMLRQLR
jgi:predicted Zn-dependent protease